jgi:predicted nucleotidyltransferase
MSPAQVLSSGRITVPREAVADFCRRHHVLRLSLFGSVLREDFRPESDVDVLVEFEPTHVPGFIRMAAMENELSKLFDRKVDLLTPNSISHYFRAKVLREALTLHDAA